MAIKDDLANFRQRLESQDFKGKHFDAAMGMTERWMMIHTLTDHMRSGRFCVGCVFQPNAGALAAQGSRVVAGYGNPFSTLMIIGEGPGEHENTYGLPFIGIAGVALTTVMNAAGIDRQSAWMSNVLRCRPKDNQTPVGDQINPCMRFLRKEIDIIKPKTIVVLGNPALHALFPKAGGITKERGVWKVYSLPDGTVIDVMPTLHPAYVIRQTGDDLRQAKTMVFHDFLDVVENLKSKSEV